MKLEYNKKYLINNVNDLDKFKFKESVKKYIIENLKEYNTIYISLVGSEHNYNLLRETLENYEGECEKQKKYIENMYINKKITLDDKLYRLDYLKKMNEITRKSLSETISEYKCWHNNHDDYDVIVIYLTEDK